jgi:hypothetical protein
MEGPTQNIKSCFLRPLVSLTTVFLWSIQMAWPLLNSTLLILWKAQLTLLLSARSGNGVDHCPEQGDAGDRSFPSKPRYSI